MVAIRGTSRVLALRIWVAGAVWLVMVIVLLLLVVVV